MLCSNFLDYISFNAYKGLKVGLVTFVIELIIAYFMGYVLLISFGLILGLIALVVTAVVFIYNWIVSHLGIIVAAVLFITGSIYILKVIKRKRIIPSVCKAIKENLTKLSVKSIKVAKVMVTPIKKWNDNHKPKDIKSMRKYGLISFLVGLIGAILFFYLNDLWYVSLFYGLWIIMGIYQMLYPQKALEQMNI